ncbi:hypothetical protein QE250_14760 [Chromatiaceae bacterium AAb-1]|nr:hypothetical protein [Chromatiaceae bacterium AAb-1]
MTLWLTLSEKYRALQKREKVLTVLTLLLLTFWLGMVYLLEPVWLQSRDIRQQLQQLEQQQTEAAQAFQVLELQLQEDPDAGLRQKIAELHQQQPLLDARLSRSANDFVSAEKMVTLLHDILQQSRDLQLRSLTMAEAEAITMPGQNSQLKAGLFRHSTELVVAGHFEHLLQFLQKLEQLPWVLQPERLDYQVEQYPAASMSLTFSTVSEHESVIKL